MQNNIVERFYTHTEFLSLNYYYIPGRATPIFNVYPIDIDVEKRQIIAELKYYNRKRRYYFYPCVGTFWDSKCLKEIYKLLEEVTKTYLILRIEDTYTVVTHQNKK